MRRRKEQRLTAADRGDERVVPVVEGKGEGAMDSAADAMRSDDEQYGFTAGTDQTERAGNPERSVEPLQSGLRAFGDIGAADQGLEETKPRRRIELGFGNTGFDVCAYGRHGTVSVRTVPFT